MLRFLPFFAALFFGCAEPKHDTANPAADFPGQLLQLDKYYTDHCLILACTSDTCNYTTVYAIEEGSGYFDNQYWTWTYEPPSLYIIDDHEIYVYPGDDGCWTLEGDVSLFGETPWSLTLNACPCDLDLYE
jgi:hypothetical protein